MITIRTQARTATRQAQASYSAAIRLAAIRKDVANVDFYYDLVQATLAHGIALAAAGDAGRWTGTIVREIHAPCRRRPA